MNVAYSLVLVCLLPALSTAQTRPTTQPTSTSAAVTRPAGTDSTLTAVSSTTTAAPAPRDPVTEGRRLQRLYDEYHSVSKTGTTATAPRSTSTATASRPTTPSTTPRPQPTTTEPRSRPVESRPSFAESRISRLRIGVRGGITYPIYLRKYEGLTLDPVVGFVGGVVLNIGAGTISFQPEINYSRVVSRTTVISIPPAGPIRFRRAVDRFEVPLLVKFATGTYAGHRFFVNAGPYGSYLASASTEGRNESLEGISGRFGFGAAAGAGALLKAGPGHVSLEVRGLYDMGNLDQGLVNSRVILSQATVGYLIPLGGR